MNTKKIAPKSTLEMWMWWQWCISHFKKPYGLFFSFSRAAHLVSMVGFTLFLMYFAPIFHHIQLFKLFFFKPLVWFDRHQNYHSTEHFKVDRVVIDKSNWFHYRDRLWKRLNVFNTPIRHKSYELIGFAKRMHRFSFGQNLTMYKIWTNKINFSFQL